MKVALVAGFLNSHTIELAEELNKKFDFKFILTENHLNDAAYDFGKEVITADYVVNYYEDDKKPECCEFVKICDFVIFAGSSDKLMQMRMKTGGLSFFYSERFFKKGRIRGFIPKNFRSIHNKLIKHKNNKDLRVLCASAYLPYDLTLYGFGVDKCYKWGYFPRAYTYENIDEIIDKKQENSLLFCARFLRLKHPEIIVKAAKKLRDNGYSFKLTFVGDGAVKQDTEDLVKRYNLCEYVEFTGGKTVEEVREYMERSEIFLFTSDRREGWGAVLNEAMNSGCAVVATHAAGSVPFVIEDGKNGLIFKSKSVDDLYKKIAYLIENKEKAKEIRKEAYNTIINKWSAKNAVEALEKLAVSILNEEEISIKSGPCSKAELLKDNWYKGEK